MNQDIFSKTVTHLLRQGATPLKSSGFDGNSGFGSTFFRGQREGMTKDGKLCALCYLSSINSKMPNKIEQTLFICHDYVPQERWPGFLRGIARFFGLSELSIDIWEAEQAPETSQERHTAPPATLQENNAKILP